MDENTRQIIQAVATFLSRDDVDFLDRLAKDSFFSTGSKVPRATLIAWMVDILKSLNIDGKDIRDENDLEAKLLEAIKLINDQREKSHE